LKELLKFVRIVLYLVILLIEKDLFVFISTYK
jgi:hypothetical protein